MDEYIKRQDALEKIEYDEYYHSNEVKDILRDVPAADVAPVRRGKFKKSELKEEWFDNFYTCLQCGEEFMVYGENGNELQSLICPRCGSMGG